MGMIADECRGKSNDFIDGYVRALWAFAWWKDGVQYVGTTGTTLKEGIAEVEALWNYLPPKEDELT